MLIHHDELLNPIDLTELYDMIVALQKRIDLCEKVFTKIMQHDVRLQTLEFNSPLSVEPSASEKLLDMQLRLERLESYLINGAKNE